ncbi:MAG: hypothetical protein CO030_02145 [Candidatus Magasanikbacteria bacterium CG_4_9_14_0_2_um_filter_42_11]|uniref:RNA polymerase sigma factor n=1 Tax=Candidatus Magasanikbacteria bacterium CG_4_9_14_0_2_um_filter_42_11 TaxID=1974643 RepID=A0A2M8FA31_9BACT|nr:MAG: hypothetical protein COU34_02095 [Candidatus Magasanikbacteria bacterium CG10_big_fil_rev_8_21_14_0_10_43_9]PIY92970.1 MAG: hypothetical protein COY70_00485 [Candidatus Magasanikbacteria bacterium CG_4_10_14_0_8_um_filter_42_12]PJC52577.1 MAG: hypothetical protein CO030_02145 [Candidatus Magasanikbacteria bacterium CG_4_9_14_0_2_um_filter_42_11]
MAATQEDIEQRFMTLYDTYQDAIFRHCYFRVYHREIAKELAQEAFMKVWDYLQKGNTLEHPKAFLYKIATNTVIDYRRRKKEDSLEQLQDTGFQPAGNERIEDATDSKMDVDALMTVLDTLEDIYCEAFLLRYIEGLKPKEIAVMTGETVNVISVRITRAKRQVQQKMKHIPTV